MFGVIMKKSHQKSKIMFIKWGDSEYFYLISQEKTMYKGKDVVVLQVMPVHFKGNASYSSISGFMVEFVYKTDFDFPSFGEMKM